LGKYHEKVFAASYLARFDGGIGKMKIQESEVQKLEFVFADDLEKDLKKFPKKYSPHSNEYWLRIIDGVKKMTGV